MNSKEKGNIGESRILWEFAQRGVQVSIPFGDNARYDLIAEFNGRLNKIQIKYCDCDSENDSIVLCCRSSYNHTTNKRLSTYEHDVDYFAFYIPKWDLSLLVPIGVLAGKKSFTVRKTPTKNGQVVGTHTIDNYLFDHILCTNSSPQPKISS